MDPLLILLLGIIILVLVLQALPRSVTPMPALQLSPTSVLLFVVVLLFAILLLRMFGFWPL